MISPCVLPSPRMRRLQGWVGMWPSVRRAFDTITYLFVVLSTFSTVCSSKNIPGLKFFCAAFWTWRVPLSHQRAWTCLTAKRASMLINVPCCAYGGCRQCQLTVRTYHIPVFHLLRDTLLIIQQYSVLYLQTRPPGLLTHRGESSRHEMRISHELFLSRGCRPFQNKHIRFR